jgi:hypothetical protein
MCAGSCCIVNILQMKKTPDPGFRCSFKSLMNKKSERVGFVIRLEWLCRLFLLVSNNFFIEKGLMSLSCKYTRVLYTSDRTSSHGGFSILLLSPVVFEFDSYLQSSVIRPSFKFTQLSLLSFLSINITLHIPPLCEGYGSTNCVEEKKTTMKEQEETESNEFGWQDEVQVMSDVHFGCLPQATSCTTIFSIVQPVPASAGGCS